MLLKFISATAVAISLTTTAFAEPTVFGQKIIVSRTADIPTALLWRSALSQFKTDRQYFSALYVSDNSDFWFFPRGYHSLKVAISFGKTGCEKISEGPCSLYAISYPEGVDPNSFPSGLSNKAGKIFSGKYQRRQKDKNWGAFAISETDNFGYSFNWKTKDKAREVALKYCNDNVIEQADEDKTLGNPVTYDKCEIIHMHKPTE